MVPLARRDAYAVFLGQVIRADTVAQDTSSLSPDPSQYPRQVVRVKAVRFTFAVERTWKGPRDREWCSQVMTSTPVAAEPTQPE
jgi:hypothetical protein